MSKVNPKEMIKIKPNQQPTTVNLRLQEVLAACGKAKETKGKPKRANGNKETKESNENKNEIKGEQNMTNEMKVFNFKENQVRTEVKDNEIWFVAKEVCAALKIVDVSNAISRLPEIMKGKHTVRTPGGPQEVLVINEPGIYKLAFTSRKKEAEEFTNWLATDVIPSIRKHGAYMTQEVIEKTIANPDLIIQLATQLKEEQLKTKAASDEKLLRIE